MPVFKHRDRLTVFSEILKKTRESKEGKRKIDIVRGTNLSYPQAEKYLNLLITNGFLYMNTNERYKPTEKGLKLVKILQLLNVRLK